MYFKYFSNVIVTSWTLLQAFLTQQIQFYSYLWKKNQKNLKLKISVNRFMMDYFDVHVGSCLLFTPNIIFHEQLEAGRIFSFYNVIFLKPSATGLFYQFLLYGNLVLLILNYNWNDFNSCCEKHVFKSSNTLSNKGMNIVVL